MKTEAGIDLSDLSEAQRKMCVRLLAMNNVEFVENQNSYVATLKVPSSQVNTYLNKQSEVPKNKISTKANVSHLRKDSQLEKVKSSLKQKKQNKTEKQNILPKEKIEIKGKISKTTNVQTTPSKRQIVKSVSGKKPLFRAVKLSLIPKIEALHPQVQIYIYPKRQTLIFLQEIIEQVYEQFWQMSRVQLSDSFHNCFYEIVCPHTGSANKSKNDQALMNVLQTINHFQHKQVGVKIFLMFLTQQYSAEQLSYFLVLRALMEQLVGEKIINIKIKQKNSSESGFSHSTIFGTAPIKQKLRWNPYEKEIPEGICENFLKVVVPQATNIDGMFERLTEVMYYCEQKKSNFIKYCDLLDFMLKDFHKQIQDSSLSNLQLSYSNNGSTINDIFIQSNNRLNFDQPLQTNFEITLRNVEEDQIPIQEEAETPHNNQILLFKCEEKVSEMCRKLEMNESNERYIMDKVKLCVQSIITMDKMKWVEAMEIQGSQQELFYIEQVQMLYRSMCEEGALISLPNNVAKKIIMGPGFIGLFESHIMF